VVDDDPFVLDAWQAVLESEATVHTYSSLEELQSRIESDSNFMANIDLAITDLYFNSSQFDGAEVGRFIKTVRPGIKVLLSSDAIVTADKFCGAIDQVIPKEPLSLSDISRITGTNGN
jgi:DNA-binding NtrC family response regulator